MTDSINEECFLVLYYYIPALFWKIKELVYMMKICIVYNFAAHYRGPVFVEIDKAFDCDWYFGKANDDIKKMDYGQLHGSIHELDTRKIGPVTWYKGVIGLLRKKEYDTFLVFAMTKDLSTWVFGLIAKLLYSKKNVVYRPYQVNAFI